MKTRLQIPSTGRDWQTIVHKIVGWERERDCAQGTVEAAGEQGGRSVARCPAWYWRLPPFGSAERESATSPPREYLHPDHEWSAAPTEAMARTALICGQRGNHPILLVSLRTHGYKGLGTSQSRIRQEHTPT